MKGKICIGLTFFVFLALLLFGLNAKKNYKDLNDEENPLNHFVVGLFPDSLLDTQIKHLEKDLPSCNIIVAVRCTQKSRFLFSCTTQEAEIVKVFKGNVNVGDIINVARGGSRIFFDKDCYVNGMPTINMNFVNEMEQGKEYLLFLDRKLETYDDDNIYIQSDEFVIAPIFCYSDVKNAICVSETSTSNSAAYKNVKNNEFFMMSEEGIKKINDLKITLLDMYPYFH